MFAAVSPALRWHTIHMLGLAIVTGIALALLFDWSADQFVGVPLGALIWGLLGYFIEIDKQVPDRPLPELPPGAVVGAIPSTRKVTGLAIGFLLSVCLAWLADRWDVGSVFVPGMFAGYGLAALVGAGLVWRWERRHSQRVIAYEGGGETLLYGADPY